MTHEEKEQRYDRIEERLRSQGIAATTEQSEIGAATNRIAEEFGISRDTARGVFRNRILGLCHVTNCSRPNLPTLVYCRYHNDPVNRGVKSVADLDFGTSRPRTGPNRRSRDQKEQRYDRIEERLRSQGIAATTERSEIIAATKRIAEEFGVSRGTVRGVFRNRILGLCHVTNCSRPNLPSLVYCRYHNDPVNRGVKRATG